ncbi:MAG: DNA polymerase I [Phocaeicola sp.]|nr:DNA polymerase I [Phocaeicola sp.]
MKKLLLLDAYALIYRAYYALIRTPRINSKGQNTSAAFGFVNTLEELLKKENPTHIGVAFDPKGGTFRHEAYPAYKAQREETPEAIRFAIPYIKAIVEAYQIPIIEIAGYEADDVIGTLATQAGAEGVDTYMVTPDKDYAQLVAPHIYIYRPNSGGKEAEILGVEEVKAKYDLKDPKQVIDLLGLMGDAVDNIPGCPGVGEKTAQKLIAEFGNIENLLLQTDKLKGKQKENVEEFAEQIRFSKFLATIKCDVPVALDWEALERKSPDADALQKLFEELEFRTLIQRVLKNEKTVAPSVPLQGSLFAEFETEDPSVPENSTLKRLNDVSYNYKLIDNKEDARKIAEKFLSEKIISVDTETTGVDPMTARIVGMSFSTAPREAYYVALPSEKQEAQAWIELFRPVLENEQIQKVGQNIKYDMLILSHYGVDFRGELFDTMIAHYVLQPELRHNMDYLAEVYLRYETIKIEELIGPKGKGQANMADLPPAEIYKYACEDADITLQLKEVLEAELHKEGVYTLFREIEMPLVPVLAYMERNGVRLDTDALKETSEIFTRRMVQIEEEVHKLADMEFNISSPKQVGEVLFEHLKLVEKPKKTKTGQYVTSEEVLETLRGKHLIVEKILEYRGLKKLLSTYVDALPTLIHPETHRLHTSFNQAVTATGRLSSSNPNIQNIPIRNEDGKEIRKAFVPDEGCLFFSADYSQIELRIMAHLSKDPQMIAAFQSGEDIHTATAAKIFKVPTSEVSREQRSKAKTANFGIIYGISIFGLAERMNVDRKEAKMLIDGYFQTYPRVQDYMQESIARAKEKGYIETLLHRKRYLPDINSANAVVRGYAERNAINAPVQGSAADIIKIAMVRIYERFRRENIRSKMILQVHDELNFSVLPEEREIVERIVLEEMQRAYPLAVPLQADAGWGKNWLEAH